MTTNDAVVNDFLSAIRNREIARGSTNRNDIDAYALGYFTGTLSTLIRKYPGVREDIQSYIDHIQNDITGAKNA